MGTNNNAIDVFYYEEDISFGDFLEKSTGKKNRFSYNFKNDLVVTDKAETSE